MQLSEKTIKICKLTAPVLEKHSGIIMLKLYDILFENYPETKAYFGGTPDDQQKKLVASIAAYASNLEDIEVLDNAVESMSKKYVKTDVKPEHSPMVGESLLQAIKDIFGDAATDEIIEAWEEAYFFLGDILIVREKELYASA